MQKGITCLIGSVCFVAVCFLHATADCSAAQGRADHALRLDINGHAGEVTSLAISSDDRLIVSGGMDGRIRIWDIGDGRELHVFGENREVVDVAFSPDDKQVLCAVRDEDNKYVLQIWDYRKQKLRKTVDGYGQRITIPHPQRKRPVRQASFHRHRSGSLPRPADRRG